VFSSRFSVLDIANCVVKGAAVSKLWLGPYCLIAAWLGLLLAAASPPQGFGMPLCWFREMTDIECPGCGLTRSLSSGLRGRLLESWHFHPMGLLILGLFLFIALQSLLPAAYKHQVLAYIERRAAFFKVLYVTFVAAFVGFGVVRALGELVTKLVG